MEDESCVLCGAPCVVVINGNPFCVSHISAGMDGTFAVISKAIHNAKGEGS